MADMPKQYWVIVTESNMRHIVSEAIADQVKAMWKRAVLHDKPELEEIFDVFGSSSMLHTDRIVDMYDSDKDSRRESILFQIEQQREARDVAEEAGLRSKDDDDDSEGWKR